MVWPSGPAWLENSTAPTRNASAARRSTCSLDGIQQASHDRLAQVGSVQNIQAGVGSRGVHQGAAGGRIRPAERRMGAEQLSAAISLLGVGVHDAARQLDQLAHMTDEQHFRKVFGCRHVQRFTDKI